MNSMTPVLSTIKSAAMIWRAVESEMKMQQRADLLRAEYGLHPDNARHLLEQIMFEELKE